MREEFLLYQAQTTNFSSAFQVERAEGSYIFGSDGVAYLDFVAGVSANTVGHSNPFVNKTMIEQINKHLHVMVYGEFVQKYPVKLCKLLADKTPEDLEMTYLLNSGAEAIDASLKLAKRITGRDQIVAMRGAYHGNTHGAMSVSDAECQKRAFRPLLPNVEFIGFNSLPDLSRITHKTAAVIAETIQGAAGNILPERGYLPALKKRCEQVGALLILDEIQPGFGRTGKLFGFEWFDVVPDILVLGKGMANGMPIGAVMASRKHMLAFAEQPMLGHITTFGGNPVIAAAGWATLHELLQTKLMDAVADKEERFRALLVHHKIKQIHGKGLMLGVEFDGSFDTQVLARKCQEKGLIVFWLLYRNDILRISPPLTINWHEIEKGCRIILQALDEMEVDNP